MNLKGDIATAELKRLLEALAAMRVHQSVTAGAARKKPLLVLLLISILARDGRQSRQFRFVDLEEELRRLIESFGGREFKAGAHPEQPFYHLGSEPFWTCTLTVPKPTRRRTPNPSAIAYGELSEDAFQVLRDAALRGVVVEALLARWWPAQEHADLRAALGFGVQNA